jgi:hypothetical protein
MPYSDSMHFSEQLSYEILFIMSYSLKDINLCKIQILAEISENREKNYDAETGLDLTDDESMQIALGDSYGGRILG